MVQYGDKIRALRALHKMNQADLAKRVGVARLVIVNIEQGQVVPVPAIKSKMDEVFGIEVETRRVDDAFGIIAPRLAQPAALAA